MKIHGIPRIFRITTHRWEFHRSASTTPSPTPNPCPIIRGERILVRVNRHNARFRIEFPASRKLSDTLAGEGDGDEALASVGRAVDTEQVAKKENKERETERRNKRQKDREGGSERNAGRDESRQRIRLNFFACDVRPLLFSTLPSARNSIFVSARVYTRFSDNLPRQWEDTLHRAPPVYIPIATVYPPISAGADENELSSFEPSSFTDPAPNSNGRARRLPLRARRQRRRTKTRLRVIRWCVYRASVGRGVTG